MKLCEKNQQLFNDLAITYIANNRSTTSQEIFELLEKNNPKLLKHIIKASKKIGPVAYIGRNLLAKYKKEGWLVYKDKSWKVNLVQERCAQCFKPLDKVRFAGGFTKI